MQSVLPFSMKRNLLRGCAVAAIAIGILFPTVASAQISRVGISVGSLEPGLSMRGTDTAYDPVRDVYLLLTGNGPVFGVFVNPMGVPVTGAFAVMDGSLGWAHFPRAEYSPDVLGGQGGFLVTWHHNVGNANYVFGRVVSMASPALLVSPIQQLSDATEGGSWWETGVAMAYSQTSKRFLIAWRTLAYGVSGRFVDVAGTPISGILPLAPPAAGAGNRDPALAWNAATDDFGLVATGWTPATAVASFRKIRAFDGYIWPPTYFGFGKGTFSSAIDVNTTNNNFVVAWGIHPGTMTAVFDQAGTLIVNSTLVTGRLGFDQSLALAFNPVSGTLLAVSSDINSFEIGGVEVTGYGAPNGLAQIITNGATMGSFYPMVSARGGLNNWDVVYTRDFRGATNQLIATTATGGGQGPPPPPPPGPAPAPTGCATPDPFVAIGGGTCISGGWIPGGAPAPAPAPTSTPTPAPAAAPTGCTTPDPFVSIGGGTCVSGGWRPGGASPTPSPAPAPAPTPAPAPAPAPTAVGCSTPDPFVSIGGGTCVSGGWRPGVVAPAPAPAPAQAPAPTPSPTSCAISDPFVSLGGGMCISGGWRPR